MNLKKDARFVEKIHISLVIDVAFPSWVIQETEERCKICTKILIFHYRYSISLMGYS
ncbi:hypothetical protein HanPSC8_Chr03g0116271 [Helianthus annuus]|nr:hypothetical protein HanPSC8_Chr03g0116271 [Helianthus annuus]